MREVDLQSKLMLRLRKINSTWWYKIPDPTKCPGCGIIALAGKRPFDIVGAFNSIPVAIEVKRSAGIPLEPHQHAQLRLFTIAGGFAFKLEKDMYYLMDPNGKLDPVGNIQSMMNMFKEL